MRQAGWAGGIDMRLPGASCDDARSNEIDGACGLAGARANEDAERYASHGAKKHRDL